MNNTSFSSRLGSALTLIGVAVGLGNVWRFPYMMGSYGGSAFLFIYLILTLLFAYPALMTEMALGKKSGRGTIIAFMDVLGPKWGKLIGFFLLVVITISGSYYAVIVSNVVFTGLFSVAQGFSETTTPSYTSSLQNGMLQYPITLVVVLAALCVCYMGVSRGIEPISKFVMPVFALSIIYLIIYSISLPGAWAKLLQFLNPDFSRIGSSELFAALGQAFFSVGLGGTFVIVYGGYLRTTDGIPKMALLTSLGDVGSSVVVSLFLIPAFLVFGINMDSGPSLIFNTFPELFAAIPNGRFVGSLFLISLSLVAFLSLIAAYQVPISSLLDYGIRITRKQLFVVIGIVQAILIIPSTFYPQIIGPLDMIFGSGMQMFGSFLAVAGIWWGITKTEFFKMIFTSDNKGKTKLMLFWLKWVVPITLLAVLSGYVYNSVM